MIFRNSLIATQMLKSIVFVLFILNSIILSGQNLSMTFSAAGAADKVDSVKATNLRTNENVTLPGDQTLILNANTATGELPGLKTQGNLFPNPFSGKTTYITSVQNTQTVILSVHNLAGQVISKTKAVLQPGTHSFRISVSRAGVYMVSLTTDQGTEGFKVICKETTNAGDWIRYTGLVESEVHILSLKNTTVYSLGYSYGDIILYRNMTGIYTTIITDSPTESKNYEVEFSACTDSEGKNYAIVKVGSQTWMAENLAYLPAVNKVAKGSDSLKRYYVYDYDDSLVDPAKNTGNYKIYGVLYNWPAAMNTELKVSPGSGRSQAVCPAGWHMPDDSEWKELEMALGMSQYDADTLYLRSSGEVGMKLKSSLGWINAGNGSNLSGFTVLPGGYRNTHGEFQSIDNYALYWTASLSDTLAYYRSLSFNDNGVYRIPTLKSHGLSVRCVRDPI
jgi:uncharacterized protein (TIGR02145 family)